MRIGDLVRLKGNRGSCYMVIGFARCRKSEKVTVSCMSAAGVIDFYERDLSVASKR